MERKNIKDQHAPVDDLHLFQRILQIFDLRRCELAVKDHHMDLAGAAELCKLLYLSAADISTRIGRFFFLYHAGVNIGAGRFGKARKLIKGRLRLPFVRSLFHHGDEDNSIFFLFIKNFFRCHRYLRRF